MLHVCCSAVLTKMWKLKGFDCLYQNIHSAVNLPLQIGTIMMHIISHHDVPASYLVEIPIDIITPSNRMRNDVVTFLAIL
jgi:hypothetical protein